MSCELRVGDRNRRRRQDAGADVLCRNSQLTTRNSQLLLATPQAFTLTELIIAVALIIFLMVGVQVVFQTTSATIGAGQAFSSMNRDHRAVQAVLFNDFRTAVKTPPWFVLHSRRVERYLNAADAAGDRDGDPMTRDVNRNGVDGEAGVGGEIVPLAACNDRNHRVDCLGLFARDLYRRHTANDGNYVSSTTANEAYIWLGHLAMPTRDGNEFCGPGEQSATPGRSLAADPGWYPFGFASQWAVGRVAVLLRDPATIPAGEIHLARAAANPPDLSPLAWNSAASAGSWAIQQSRYDLAGTSLEQLRADVSFQANLQGPGNTWWTGLVYGTGINGIYRFQCQPMVARPITSAAMARTTPMLLANVSQFVAEYAGDYLTQDPATGAVTALAADGQPDFMEPVAGRRQVRWYGLPRDLNGDGIIRIADDVVPLRDLRDAFLRANSVTPTGGSGGDTDALAGHERQAPALQADYGIIPVGSAASFRYTCVWRNDMPPMVRLVLRLEDPTGRLGDGQWCEWVLGGW